MFARPRALRQEPIAIGSLLSDTASLMERDPNMLNLEIAVNGDPNIIGSQEIPCRYVSNILMNAARRLNASNG